MNIPTALVAVIGILVDHTRHHPSTQGPILLPSRRGPIDGIFYLGVWFRDHCDTPRVQIDDEVRERDTRSLPKGVHSTKRG